MFAATDGATGIELHRSNAETVGTVLVKDIRLGATGSVPQRLVNLNGTLFFTAADGTTGRELWKSGIFGSTTASMASNCELCDPPLAGC